MQSALVVASGVIQAQQQRRAGQIAEAQAQIDANAEGDAAREREIQRKRGLSRALSSQVAQAGAAGVAFSEGSKARVAQLDIAEANRDTALDTAGSRARQRALRLQGKNARIAGNAAATATLLDTTSDAIEAAKPS